MSPRRCDPRVESSIATWTELVRAVDLRRPLKYSSKAMTRSKSQARFNGRVQLYTGDGKGKTSAALGLVFRAAGRGLRSFVGQFCKGRTTGETAAAKMLASCIVIRRFGGTGFLRAGTPPSAADRNRARRGIAVCRRAMLSGLYRIVVLDEITLALYFKLLAAAEVRAFLDARPAGVEIVMTGRKAPAWLAGRADLITEMKERKHYYAAGLRARRGIED